MKEKTKKKKSITTKNETYIIKRKEEQSRQAALLIFLNRACFNGLYRVNRKNEYNVPMGSYKRPTICEKENILAVSQALQKVEILCGDYEETLGFANHSPGTQS